MKHSRTRTKNFREMATIHFCPNFLDDCPNHDRASFHGNVRMSLRFNVKTFFLHLLFQLYVNEAEAIGFSK